MDGKRPNVHKRHDLFLHPLLQKYSKIKIINYKRVFSSFTVATLDINKFKSNHKTYIIFTQYELWQLIFYHLCD